MAGKIRKNRNQIKELTDSGRLRQILEHGYLSVKEIQTVIDAVYDSLRLKQKKEIQVRHYKCEICGRHFYVPEQDMIGTNIDFGCPYGCDNNGRYIGKAVISTFNL